ncbi:MAG TPA: D-alanine--D-alanine ligase [Gemmatimonadaceae bacterium]|nr:D-alanine--D-alanine ligase [Gemmatimonadaceae bacterium]
MLLTVLLGGTSSERNVSLASGLRMAAALREAGHVVRLLDPATGVIDESTEAACRERSVGVAPPPEAELSALRANDQTPTLPTHPLIRDAECVVLALHGGQGEDGTVQALLDVAGVRYTGSGAMATAIAMDKDMTKRILVHAGVPTAAWRMVPIDADLAIGKLGLPLIVKPNREGSTVGLTVVKERAQFDGAVAEALRFDREVMCETFVPGRELTVPVLAGEALPVGEIIPVKEIYDYECKYTPGMASEVFPADLPSEMTERVQRYAERAYVALKLRGCARIDFRLTAEGTLACLEANTLPGMTALSLVPQSAAAAGVSFVDFCDRLVQDAVR